jgi:hypothetical protein
MQCCTCRTASHTRSVLSCEPLTKRRAGSARCAGSQATDVTHFVWPCAQGGLVLHHSTARYISASGCSAAACAGVALTLLTGRQLHTVMRLPMFDLLSSYTQPCRFSLGGLLALVCEKTVTRQVPLSLPLSACQTRICPSMLPLTRYFASGDHATQSTQFL